MLSVFGFSGGVGGLLGVLLRWSRLDRSILPLREHAAAEPRKSHDGSVRRSPARNGRLPKGRGVKAKLPSPIRFQDKKISEDRA